MSRAFPQSGNFRTFPLPAPSRTVPLPFKETPFRLAQGSAKAVQLGQLVWPFWELSISKLEETITQIRYKQDAGEWVVVSQGNYPSLLLAARSVNFTPAEFGDYVFYLEITAGDFLTDPPRKVDISAAAAAGADKVVIKNAPIKPFFDSKFSLDSSLLSTVEYSIDDGTPAAIPTEFGTDLIKRVKNFSLSFSSSGEKKISLIITDTETNESQDALLMRVSS